MNTSLRLARANAYPAIASLLNAREDGDHQVEAGEFQRCAERWVRHDRAFRRVVGVTDGVIVTTGCVCADWGGRTEPGQSWVNIAVPPGPPAPVGQSVSTSSHRGSPIRRCHWSGCSTPPSGRSPGPLVPHGGAGVTRRPRSTDHDDITLAQCQAPRSARPHRRWQGRRGTRTRRRALVAALRHRSPPR